MGMHMPPFEVEVVSATAGSQQLIRILVSEGCSAAQAIAMAGLTADWRDRGGDAAPLARFGRLITPETVLAAGDRVEILRPLQTDPKDQRRQRARAASRARRRVS